MVPSRCEAQFDMHIPIGVSSDTFLQEIERIAHQEGKDEVEIKFMSQATEANATPPSDPFVQLVLQAIKEARGDSPQPMLQWASSDARYFLTGEYLLYSMARLSLMGSTNMTNG